MINVCSGCFSSLLPSLINPPFSSLHHFLHPSLPLASLLSSTLPNRALNTHRSVLLSLPSSQPPLQSQVTAVGLEQSGTLTYAPCLTPVHSVTSGSSELQASSMEAETPPTCHMEWHTFIKTPQNKDADKPNTFGCPHTLCITFFCAKRIGIRCLIHMHGA